MQSDWQQASCAVVKTAILLPARALAEFAKQLAAVKRLFRLFGALSDAVPQAFLYFGDNTFQQHHQ